MRLLLTRWYFVKNDQHAPWQSSGLRGEFRLPTATPVLKVVRANGNEPGSSLEGSFAQ